jgi:hypothetical protein
MSFQRHMTDPLPQTPYSSYFMKNRKLTYYWEDRVPILNAFYYAMNVLDMLGYLF